MQDNDEDARIKLVMKQMRHDIVVLLRSGQDATSRIRFLQTKDLVPEGFVFKNLIHLELQTNYTETDLMGLAAFFKGCLNLQMLIVDHDATGQDVINPVEAIRYVVVVDKMFSVQNKSFGQPTILVAKSMKGEEYILDGAVVVLTPDMPNVLSHVSVQARNSKVCFATCFDPNILADLQANERKLLQIKPISADIVYSKVEGGLTSASSTNLNKEGPLLSIKLVRKQFGSRYVISLEEFTSEAVGAK